MEKRYPNLSFVQTVDLGEKRIGEFVTKYENDRYFSVQIIFPNGHFRKFYVSHEALYPKNLQRIDNA